MDQRESTRNAYHIGASDGGRLRRGVAHGGGSRGEEELGAGRGPAFVSAGTGSVKEKTARNNEKHSPLPPPLQQFRPPSTFIHPFPHHSSSKLGCTTPLSNPRYQSSPSGAPSTHFRLKAPSRQSNSSNVAYSRAKPSKAMQRTV